MSGGIVGTSGIRISAWGGFGKLPTHGDFLKAQGRSVQAMEGWMQEGLFYARRELGPAFDSRYDEGLDHGFVFRPDNTGQTVVGLIQRSWDAVGRRFPFAVFGLLPSTEWDRATLLVPLLADDLFAGLDGALGRALQPGGPAEVAAYPPLPLEVHPSAMSRYCNFLQDVECGDLGAPGAAPGEQAVVQLMDLLVGLGQDPRRLPFAVALPLTQPAPSRWLLVRFWIELCLILTARYPPTLSLFMPSLTAAEPRLWLCFRPPTGALFGALLRPALPCRAVWHAGAGLPPGAIAGRADTPEEIHGQTSLWDVLHAARRVTPGQIPAWLAGTGVG